MPTQASPLLKRYFYLFLLVLSSILTARELPHVADSYGWLEDAENPQTQRWIEEQKCVFAKYASLNPYRDEVKTQLKKLLDFATYSIPIQRDNRYFFYLKRADEEQGSLYVQEGLDGAPRLLIQGEQLNRNGVVTALMHYAPSSDGQLLAYAQSENGSDWTRWYVLDVASGKLLDDCVEQTKFFDVTWEPDSQGFYYTRVNNENLYAIYYHRLGTLQSADPLIYVNLEDSEICPTACFSSDYKYLILHERKGFASNTIRYMELKDNKRLVSNFISDDVSSSSFICNIGSRFYFLTNKDASFGKIIAINIDEKREETVIPERSSAITQVVCFDGHFLVNYLEDVSSRLSLYDLQGKWIRNLPLPGMGTIELLNSTEHKDKELFFSFTNFFQPREIYRYTLAKPEPELFKKASVQFNSHDYVARQIFYSSKDGTQVPMFIVHKKNLPLNETQKTLLYAYGGFNFSLTPRYSSLHMAWLEQGGVIAIANIRGGGEYGEAWHKAGIKKNRQNCFDDFIAAAEWLIDNHYTQPSQLAIQGASNGGLLVAVCLNQRPELFGAALVQVGVLDMLRFHLFTAGRFWMTEYGHPSDPDDCKVLRGYSPYHNVRIGAPYPPTLVTAGEFDDRVVPLHSYKYTAARQEAKNDKSRVLLRIDAKAGHGAGKTTSQYIEEGADLLSFLMAELGTTN